MDATLVAAPETALPRDYSHLKRYQFQPGNQIAKLGGRPKGVLNSQTVLLRSAPKLAKAYVKEGCAGNATILTDARKWIMPTDGELANGETSVPGLVINFGIVTPLPASLPPSCRLHRPCQRRRMEASKCMRDTMSGWSGSAGGQGSGRCPLSPPLSVFSPSTFFPAWHLSQLATCEMTCRPPPIVHDA